MRGWGGEALLKSYSQERLPVFKSTARDFIESLIESDKAFLARYHPERDRAEFERAWGERAAGGSTEIHSFEPHYEGSPVVYGPPNGASSARGSHEFTVRAGHHLSPQPLSSGRNVYEELGLGFSLLAFDVEDRPVRAFERAAETHGVPLNVIRDTYRGQREAYGSRLILVRPDQFVAWAGDTPPSDAGRLIKKVTGQP